MSDPADPAAPSNKVILISSDEKSFEVEVGVAEMSATIKNMLTDLGDTEGTPIPLPNVTGACLAKVVEFCNHHHNSPAQAHQEEKRKKPKKDEEKKDDIDPWDREFMNVNQVLLFDLIMAANFLDIKSLLDLGCKIVANLMKGNTPEQIRVLFSIKNDFTPEEEEEMFRENGWKD